ncbi:MAG: sialate O-acetylesterase [Phycisphaerales bacterium]|nr:sialate O-acetylesterase [Phycisphaerales bacterium]
MNALLIVCIATLEVTPLVGDHAVLQQGRPIPVWGTAAPGQEVRVVFTDANGAKEHREVRADAQGAWLLELAPRPASADGATIDVASGSETWRAEDVLVGEVWIASGQSNMEWPLHRTSDAEASAQTLTNHRIREFKIPHAFDDAPRDEISGAWLVAGPDTTPGFSGVAWNFATMLSEELDVPLGIVNSSWGGSSVEAWMSLEQLDEVRGQSPPVQRAVQDWYDARSQKAEDVETLTAPNMDHAHWNETVLPGDWSAMGLGETDGTVFYRLAVWVPEHWAGKDLALRLGPIDDIDETFWSGHLVGSRTRHDVPRNYTVPGEHVKPGRHVIAVRNTDNAGAGGFFAKRGQMQLHPLDDPSDKIPLAGPWRWKLTSSWSRPARNTPTVLNNAMIAPLEQLPVTGVIWYQGESNAHDPVSYDVLFPAMIEDWRSRFDQPLPFHFVQLANLDHRRGDWHWPQLREAQHRALRLPDTGMALCFDVGNPRDIHPRDKRTVGRRLGRLALHHQYGRDIVPEGPRPISLEMPGDGTAVVTFLMHGGTLATRDGQDVALMEIAGTDGVFHPAQVHLDGDRAIVRSDAVSAPSQVRYGWRQDPAAANLVGAEGLPATPFMLPSTVQPPAEGATP